LGRKTTLTDKILERTDSDIRDDATHESLPLDRAARTAVLQSDDAPAPGHQTGPNGSAPEDLATEDSAPASRADSRRIRRAARVEAGKRPRTPRAEPDADLVVPPQAVPDPGNGVEAPVVEEVDAAPASDALSDAVIAFSGSGKRGARTVRRASKKQKAAADAVSAADDNPALGALNRHLNTMTQQLTTAHRILGRVAAERDALRQQLADLQGIPVEEIVVSTIGASTEAAAQPTKSSQPVAPAEPSKLAKLNYFGGDDYVLMKKRRQMLALSVLVMLVVLWLSARMGAIQTPENVSRESLSDIPLIGELVTFFLAGWILFRVVKISTKGVKWVFPSEDQRRRRR
jgi:hypothetical protein